MTELLGLINSGEKRIVIDFLDVEFISGLGLMTIIRAPRLAKHNKGDIKSASLSPRIKEVFDLAGISTLFEIYPSKDEAVESYKI